MKSDQLHDMKRHFESRLKEETNEVEIKFLEKCLEPVYKDLKITNSVEKQPIMKRKSLVNQVALKGGLCYLLQKRT